MSNPVKLLDTNCVVCGGPIYATRSDAKYCQRSCFLTVNRVRDKERQKARRAKPDHKYKYKAYIIQKNYGISIEEHEALFDSQNKSCAICNATEPGWNKGWHTDHCHETGRVRGILCHKCNLMIGLARDNAEILQAAIEYLGK